MNNYPSVYVIILNFNGGEDFLLCLESVFSSNYLNFKVVVVDNDSTDKSFDDAMGRFPAAYFIKNKKNLGFSAGNNVGIRFSLEKMADYVFLLNNDAMIEKDTISKLMELVVSNKKISIASPVIFSDYEKKKIWFAGGKISWITMKAKHLFVPEKKTLFKTEYVSGCAMLIKSEVFREIGLLSEDFFLYYEDADFCVRAQRKGFSSWVVPQVGIFHAEKSEGNKIGKTYWLVVSGIIFFKKNTSKLLRFWLWIYLGMRIIKNLIDVKYRKTEMARTIKRAYQDVLHEKF